MKLAKYTKFREEKFGGVLFETRSEKVYCLNATAAAVVREAIPGLAEDEIIERLITRFQGTPEDIATQARGFISNLRQKLLLED